ncbi:hypothetical protein [Clostridiisalibacter paucivorans]|uniref:hypothetical protein n=1 Tax=Clostridiisalibacter paucivorans TaxID=408753 RepID=UPI00047D5D71|nr:hypothetical protein [Clostridiisalibacter paucivorans]
MKDKLGFTRENIISSLAFAFFVVCPRMAGMMHVIESYTNVSMLYTVLVGIVISIPLLRLMVFIFAKSGVWAALGFCVFTDLGSALIMNGINISATIEILVIAIFMVIGVKSAPRILNIFIKKQEDKKTDEEEEMKEDNESYKDEAYEEEELEDSSVKED